MSDNTVTPFLNTPELRQAAQGDLPALTKAIAKVEEMITLHHAERAALCGSKQKTLPSAPARNKSLLRFFLGSLNHE
ncbi:MAG: hypothetical protein WCD70_16915 [Alphaproteobacteria bacterium]